VGIFQNSRYQSVAQALLQQSATAQTSPDIAAILKGDVTYNNTIYRDGEVYDPMAEMIVPGVFLVLLYVIIAIFGNQMLNATVEEHSRGFTNAKFRKIAFRDFCRFFRRETSRLRSRKMERRRAKNVAR
jgi:hypothetical protein